MKKLAYLFFILLAWASTSVALAQSTPPPPPPTLPAHVNVNWINKEFRNTYSQPAYAAFVTPAEIDTAVNALMAQPAGATRNKYMWLLLTKQALIQGDQAKAAEAFNNFDTSGREERRESDNRIAEAELPNCSLLYNVGDCVLQVLEGIGKLLVWIFSWLVVWANQIFNVAINISVREFKQYADLGGVKTAWRVMRDLVNLSFIFVLLYAAIGTILQLGGVKGKSLIKNVIIAAILVNFSAFFTGIIIDVSNVIANQLYAQAAGGATGYNGAPDIASKLTQLSTSSILDKNWGQTAQATSQQAAFLEGNSWWDKSTAIIGSYFGQVALMLISATVLFAGAVMFFMRTIVLIFVIVFSPIAFLGFAVGGSLSTFSSKWRNALTNQVIFAPTYLLIILMVVRMVDAGVAQGGMLNMISTSSGGVGLIGSLSVFAIINGMMLGALMAAKTLGVAGASVAAGGLNRLKGLGMGAVGGATGFVGRNTLGRAAQLVNTNLDNAKSRMQESRGGRLALGALQTLSLGTAGLAKRTIAQGTTAKFGGARSRQDIVTEAEAGVQARRGEPKRQANYMLGLSYAEQERAYNKLSARDKALVDKEFNANATDNERSKNGGNSALTKKLRDQLSTEEREKVEKQAKEDAGKVQAEDTKTQMKTSAEAVAAGTITSGSAEEKSIESDLRNMANKDVVKLDPDILIKLAHLLSENQIKSIEKNDDLKGETLSKIIEARENKAGQLEDAVRSGDGARAQAQMDQSSLTLFAQMIARMDKSDRDYDNMIRTLAGQITTTQLAALQATGEVKYTRLAEIRRQMATATGPSPSTPPTSSSTTPTPSGPATTPP